MRLSGFSALARLAVAGACLAAMMCLAPFAATAKKAREPKSDSAAAFRPAPNDVAKPDGFPPMGKWMYDKRLDIAAWLGGSLDGRKLREPINVVVVDRVSSTALQAKVRFVAACIKGGYKIRLGHSAGYRGFIGDRLFKQLPEERDHAFSNEPFELHNNHGRAFGPAQFGSAFLFTAALSRERYDPVTKTQHIYVSFCQARDNFAASLAGTGLYRAAGTVEMGNKVTGEPLLTTGDHDGRAVLLKAGD